MNSKLWIKKALSTCLAGAIIATYSTVALAGEKVAGELLISAQNNTSFVKVNGETAQSGRSIFSSSVIDTSDNAGAVVDLGKIGKIEIAPNTTITLSFDENGMSGDLLAGRVTVLNASNEVNIKTANGNTANLKAGESATTTPGKAQDDTSSGGKTWAIWAAVLGGAAVGIIIAATTNNNNIQVGGGTSVISPTR